MRRPSERRNGASVGLLLVATIFSIVGCSHNTGSVESPPYPSIFDRSYGLVTTVSPPTITPGVPTRIAVSARPNYSGTGFFTLEGGSESDTLRTPVVRPLATCTNWRVNFVAGEAQSVTWAVQFADGATSSWLGFAARMDSLDIDGVRYPADSYEVRTQIGSDILHVLYREVEFPR